MAIAVVREYCENMPEVECYGGELNQVFMNIIANAIDALDSDVLGNGECLISRPSHRAIKIAATQAKSAKAD